MRRLAILIAIIILPACARQQAQPYTPQVLHILHEDPDSLIHPGEESYHDYSMGRID